MVVRVGLGEATFQDLMEGKGSLCGYFQMWHSLSLQAQTPSCLLGKLLWADKAW